MADNLTNEAESGILNHIHGIATWTVTAPLKLALLTSVPSDSVLGAEPSGGSYARQTLTVGTSTSGSSVSNTNAPVFSNLPACTVAGFAIYDSSGTPKRIWHGALSTSRTFAAGDSFTVPIGALTLSMG